MVATIELGIKSVVWDRMVGSGRVTDRRAFGFLSFRLNASCPSRERRLPLPKRSKRTTLAAQTTRNPKNIVDAFVSLFKINCLRGEDSSPDTFLEGEQNVPLVPLRSIGPGALPG